MNKSYAKLAVFLGFHPNHEGNMISKPCGERTRDTLYSERFLLFQLSYSENPVLFDGAQGASGFFPI